MSSTTFFSGASPSSSVTGKRYTAAAPLATQAVSHTAPRAVASAFTAYPWMTQAMLARMSPRALRLLRADY